MSHADDEEWIDPRPKIREVTFRDVPDSHYNLQVSFYWPAAKQKITDLGVAVWELDTASSIREKIVNIIASIEQELGNPVETADVVTTEEEDETGNQRYGFGTSLKDEDERQEWIRVRATIFRAFTADTVRDAKELERTLLITIDGERHWDEFNDLD